MSGNTRCYIWHQPSCPDAFFLRDSVIFEGSVFFYRVYIWKMPFPMPTGGLGLGLQPFSQLLMTLFYKPFRARDNSRMSDCEMKRRQLEEKAARRNHIKN